MGNATSEYPVTVPFRRLVEMAEYLGSDRVNICPPHRAKDACCWLQRGLAPYIKPFPDQPESHIECRECFLRYMMNGD